MTLKPVGEAARGTPAGAEQCLKEVRKTAGITAIEFDSESAVALSGEPLSKIGRTPAGTRVRSGATRASFTEALPIAAISVVHPSLFRVGKDFVCFVDFLELVF
jgi:hypothetical protein